ncbi:unnamed protein product [Adineta steineri]|uniref:Uncharacterized protein n=1 Tax=Adineta steineri TaxID=433720 RepID=A0A819R3C5_9BILA|nr:unnamed protein product [Adineta steineri]
MIGLTSILLFTPLLTYSKIIVMLYTTPLCNTDSTSTITENADTILTDNVHIINLTLTKLIAEISTEKNTMSDHYLFRNVTKLTIDADNAWSTECVKHLFIILDFNQKAICKELTGETILYQNSTEMQGV